MKNKLQIALTALFGVSAFCFWLFVRPALIVERESYYQPCYGSFGYYSIVACLLLVKKYYSLFLFCQESHYGI